MKPHAPTPSNSTSPRPPKPPGLLSWLLLMAGIAGAVLFDTRRRSAPGREPANQTSVPGARREERATIADAEEADSEARTATATRVRRWVLVPIGIALLAWMFHLVVHGKPQVYEEDVMHFKYGSIGSDNLRRGLPYRIWKVLPSMFPKHLPPGTPRSYAAFGLITDERDAQDRPIGFSKRWHLGIGDVVGVNCAFCHVSTVRAKADGPSRIILGMPANTVDAEAFFRFLFSAANDPECTVDNVLRHIEEQAKLEHEPFGDWERFVHREVLIPLFIKGVQDLSRKFDFLERRPTPFGPGRVDTWAAYKVLALQEAFWFMEYFPEIGEPSIQMDAGPVTGLADFPALWKEKVEGGAFHWDGNNRVLEERNITAALGAGVTPATLDVDGMRRVSRWMESDLKPASYHGIAPEPWSRTPFSQGGAALFEQHCAECHSEAGSHIRRLEPIGAIGTDPERLRSFTERLRDKLNEVRHLSVWKLETYSKTEGYANLLLTGIWLRAPYLHNGSVPTLWHLLQPPERRPTAFCRGNDLYDWRHVGFEWDRSKDECRGFFTYRTTLPGNGNSGHLYGTELTDEEKGELLEYLKTL